MCAKFEAPAGLWPDLQYMEDGSVSRADGPLCKLQYGRCCLCSSYSAVLFAVQWCASACCLGSAVAKVMLGS
jgi:hypothetical protein